MRIKISLFMGFIYFIVEFSYKEVVFIVFNKNFMDGLNYSN